VAELYSRSEGRAAFHFQQRNTGNAQETTLRRLVPATRPPHSRLPTAHSLRHCRSLDAYNTWLLLDCEPVAIEKAKAAGLGRRHVNALKAGIEVLRRKRLGLLRDWNPKQSFAAIGITTPDDGARTSLSPHGYVSR
jgi:hypothetical protein